MNYGNILTNTITALNDVDVGRAKGGAELAALDRGILEVALMIAGLDGTILPSEYDAFATMAKKCRGATARNIRDLYDSAIAKAGRIAGMARSGLFTETTRMAMFVRLSAEALPRGFACGSKADLRRAFALWIAMGVSDGAFSGFEKRCVHALVRRFALARAGKAKRFVALLESDFFARTERIFRDMVVPARRAKAQVALQALIAATEVEAKVRRPASTARPSRYALPGPTVTGWK